MVTRSRAHRRLFAGVAIAVVLGGAAVAVALGESLGVDTGVIIPGRQAVNVTGTLDCIAGQSGHMAVTVSQRSRRATGGRPVRCDGRTTRWRVRVRTARGMRLSPGKAAVSVDITFAATGHGQRAIGEGGSIVLRCPSSRRQDGPIQDVALDSPGAGSRARGIARISRHHGRWQISVAAQRVPPNGRADAYAVWLHSAPKDDVLLGFVNPGVGRNGRIQTMGALPADVGCYQQIVVSRETSATPRHPGKLVLSGPIEIN